MSKKFAKPIIKALNKALQPVKNALENQEEFEIFIQDFGWEGQILASDMAAIQAAYNLTTSLDEAIALVFDLVADGDDSETKILLLFDKLEEIINIIRALDTVLTSGLPAPLDQSAFWVQMKDELFDYLIIKYLKKEFKYLFGVLHLFQVIEIEEQSVSGTYRFNYVRYKMNWGNLVDMVADLPGLLKSEYHWNDSPNDFDHKKLFKVLETILLNIGSIPKNVPPRSTLTSAYLDGASISSQDINELQIPIFEGVGAKSRNYYKTGLVILPIPDPFNSSNPPSGLMFQPVIEGMGTVSIPIGSDVKFEITGGFELDNSLRIEVFPDDVNLVTSLGGLDFLAQLALKGSPETPYILIGDPQGSRVELDAFEVGFGLAGDLSKPEFYAFAGTGPQLTPESPKFRIVLNFGGTDGFLNKILGDKDQTFEMGGMVRWSSKHGLTFEGAGGMELVIPIHLKIGESEITDLYIGLLKSGSDLVSNLAIGAIGKFGPLTAFVDKIGTKIGITPKSNTEAPGIFGNLDINFDFKWPNGVGLAIESSAISGGGFLFIDKDKGEYAGGVELNIKDKIHVSAVGLINTKMPDGSDGFSLLVIISAEFPPIQLGLGFTLNGVGGLLGLHRTVNFERMREGIKTKTLDSILFPKDIVKNAKKIVSDLREVFPVEKDRFVFGPMAILGWGTPTLISAELGVIIEVPSPIRIGILGVVRCILPTEDAAILKLQIAFLGVLDFEKKLITFDASIYDSSLLAFTLSGDMALRIGWGENKRFVISFGGFHPRFQAPPDLTRLERMTLTIRSSQPRIILESYFAVTSNTVQIGAKLELYHKLKLGYHIEGRLGFDALFQFNPFYMLLEIYFSLAVKKGNSSKLSISLDLSLEGPRPWKAKGKAKFKILMIKFSANVSATWGKSQNTSLPNKAVMPELKNALEQDPNWEALWPQGKGQLVKLREMESGSLIVHPFGKLQVGQKIVPLDLNIEKFGDFSPTLPGKYTISAVRLAGNPVDYVDLRDDFAPAHFRKMDDNAKLSSASFKKFNAGVSFKGTEE